jgi:glycosyltransferase involved in cell wall biosynthesis
MGYRSPKVSVGLITFNHAAYIGEALDGVLMQQATFPFEVVVGDDFSTDGTREILIKYAEAHPDKIRLLLPERNQGMNRNVAAILEACRGDYIALLDGDDFWTDPLKLQLQADYLDSAPECSTTFHRVKWVDEKGNELPGKRPSPPKSVCTLQDLLKRRFFADTASVMFRRGLFRKIPEWYFGCAMGDFPLHFLNGQHGAFGFIDREMAAYRVHSGGIWSATTANGDRGSRQELLRKELRQRLGIVKLYETLAAHSPKEHLRALKDGLAFYRVDAAHRMRHLEDWPGLRRMMRTFFGARHF